MKLNDVYSCKHSQIIARAYALLTYTPPQKIRSPICVATTEQINENFIPLLVNEILDKIECINSHFACSVDLCLLRMLSLKSRCYMAVIGYKRVRNLEGHSILATNSC